MSFIPCSFCGRRNLGYLSHVYWFAPVRGSDVLRVRQRLCPYCLATNLVALLTPPDAETLTCSACGISVEDDVFPIYVTYYPEKNVMEKGAMALCEEHHLEVRVRASQDAVPLEDRFIDLADRIVASPTPAIEAFRAVGRIDPGVKHGSAYRVGHPLNPQTD